jgi:hypothetical protein
MKRRILFTGLLLGLGLGAAPLALQAQINDALHDPAFVRGHRLRTVAEYWSNDESRPEQLEKWTTTYYARSGRELNRRLEWEPEPLRSTLWRSEQVRDARGRVVVEKRYRGPVLQWLEQRAYGSGKEPVYVYYQHQLDQPKPGLFRTTHQYNLRGDAIETVLETNITADYLRFAVRYRCSYDAQHRLIALTQYEGLIYPHRTDSTYYDHRGLVVRRASYSYDYRYRSQPWCESLRLYRYNARGQETSRIDIEREGEAQSISATTYRPDGQQLQQLQYRAPQLPPVPWTQAVRRTVQTLRQQSEFTETRTDYRYTQRGLLSEVVEHARHSLEYGQVVEHETTRGRWRYAYYR